MLQKMLLPIIVGFCLRQAHKFGGSIDWTKVKADVNVRVCKIIPGVMFDATACAFADHVVDACADFLKGAALDKITEHLIKGEFNEALADLFAFVKEKVGL
jgi:hypothetical protein